MISQLLGHPAICALKRDAKNNFHNYEYISVNALIHALNKACSDLGIIILPSFNEIEIKEVKTNKGKNMISCQMKMDILFIDATTNERIYMKSIGFSIDTGTKCIVQAAISGFKYCIMNTLLIADATTAPMTKIEPVKTKGSSLVNAMLEVVKFTGDNSPKSSNYKKGGRNTKTFSKYTLYPILRNAFYKNNILLNLNDIDSVIIILHGKEHFLITVEFELLHESTGEKYPIKYYALEPAEDDKSINKCISNAYKDIFRFISLSGLEEDADANSIEGKAVSVNAKPVNEKQSKNSKPIFLSAAMTKQFNEYLKDQGVAYQIPAQFRPGTPIVNKQIIGRITKAWHSDGADKLTIIKSAFSTFAWNDDMLSALMQNLNNYDLESSEQEQIAKA